MPILAIENGFTRKRSHDLVSCKRMLGHVMTGVCMEHRACISKTLL